MKGPRIATNEEFEEALKSVLRRHGGVGELLAAHDRGDKTLVYRGPLPRFAKRGSRAKKGAR